MEQKFPIEFSLVTSRSDGGKTANYHVFGGGGNVSVTNGKGEAVTKAAIVGGQSSIYIANPLAEGNGNTWVLMPKAFFEDAVRGKAPTSAVVKPKGKGKK